MSKQEIPEELRKQLEEFQVEVPEIPTKRRIIDRLAHWIYAPAKDPLELFHIKGNSITKLVFYPLVFLLGLFFVPIFFI